MLVHCLVAGLRTTGMPTRRCSSASSASWWMPRCRFGGARCSEAGMATAAADDSFGSNDRGAAGPGLYLIPTPIGNLEDITLRALKVLRRVDLLLAEDTRVAKSLLSALGISTKETEIVSCPEQRQSQRVEMVLQALSLGQSVGYVSDAGTPALSDPGANLVQQVSSKGFDVISLPGPSAITTAVAAAGFPAAARGFTFMGFLPASPSARVKALEESKARGYGRGALVFFSPPHRVAQELEDMSNAFGAHRTVCVCRELTKRYEEIYRGSLEEAAAEFSSPSRQRGEFTLVLDVDAKEKESDKAQAIEIMERLLVSMKSDGHTASASAREVAEQLDLPKRLVYNRALDIWK